jgi:hypothetical protein
VSLWFDLIRRALDEAAADEAVREVAEAREHGRLRDDEWAEERALIRGEDAG